MWRPKDWKNQWDADRWELDPATLFCAQRYGAGGRCIREEYREARRIEFEAGADAMLDVLEKRGEGFRNILPHLYLDRKKGYLLFIPDE